MTDDVAKEEFVKKINGKLRIEKDSCTDIVSQGYYKYHVRYRRQTRYGTEICVLIPNDALMPPFSFCEKCQTKWRCGGDWCGICKIQLPL